MSGTSDARVIAADVASSVEVLNRKVAPQVGLIVAAAASASNGDAFLAAIKAGLSNIQ